MAVQSGSYTLIYRINLARPRAAGEIWPSSLLQVQIERARTRRDGSLGMTEPISLKGVELPSLGPLSPEERELLGLLRHCNRAVASYAPAFAEDVLVPPEKTDEILRLLAQRDHLWDRRGQPIRIFSDKPASLGIKVRSEGGLVLTPSLQGATDPYGAYPFLDLYDGAVILLRGNPSWAFFKGAFYPLSSLPLDPEIRPFLGEIVHIPPNGILDFAQRSLPLLRRNGIFLLGNAGERIDGLLAVAPKGVLALSEQNGELYIRLFYDYGGMKLPHGESREILIDGEHGVLRDASGEGKLASRLKQEGLTPKGPLFHVKGEEALEFLVSGVPKLLSEGWKIEENNLTSLKVCKKPAQVKMRVKTGLDWFSLDAELKVGEYSIGRQAISEALFQKKRFIRLASGEWVRIPERWFQPFLRFKEALGLSNEIFGEPRIPLFQAPLALDWVGSADHLDADTSWRKLAQKWTRLASGNLSTLDEATPPPGFVGELRPYQKHGLAFMLFLREHGFHGILADDMGLGKTVQAIALLATPTDLPPLPSLVIAPTSVVYNWEKELTRFAPFLKVLSLHGPSRREHFDDLADYDVVLTSFALVRRDWMHLEKQEYAHIILDEAQAIKNSASQTSKLVRRLKGRHRFSLSGTPLENHLGELWAQFDFLLPGLFGTEKDFQERYLSPANAGDPEILAELRARSSPFILRRLKKEVAEDLPPRTEIVAYCELDPLQKELYERILLEVREKVNDTVNTHGIERSRITILDGLLKLRQVCCHPRLLNPSEIDVSSKLELFMDLVEGLLLEGHRALVFSQFVKMLDLVRKRLDERGIEFEYLDGRTRDRQLRVDRFNSSATPLFLISLKAGGTGINLTGADYVIHFDPWWNPAVEAQATDRAHRIGQSRQVFSYKLIARDTIEEKVLKLQERKKALISDVILSEEGMAKQISRDDLDFLFRE